MSASIAGVETGPGARRGSRSSPEPRIGPCPPPTAPPADCCSSTATRWRTGPSTPCPVENFSTTTGQPTNAVYGFTSMLINCLRDEDPTHVAVAFDVSRQTFRTEEFPAYKATRSASPDEFKGQVALVREVLDALRIPSLAIEGYEADDVIATLTREAVAQGFEVDIVTGDRDAFQLVGDRVTVLYPKKGVSDLARMTPAGRRGALRPDAGAVPRLRGAARRPERQPAQRARGGGEDRGEVGARVRLAGGAGRPGRRGAGQGGPVAARPPRPGGDATAGSPSSSTCPTCRTRSTTWRARRGTATRCTRSSTRCSSGCCASGCTRRWRRAEPEADEGVDVEVERPAAGALGGLVGRAHGRRAIRGRLLRALGARHRRPRRGGDRRRGRRGGVRRAGAARQRGRAGAGRLAGRSRSAQGRARRQGPAARGARPGLAAARA